MKYVIATAIVLMLAIGVMVIGPRWANAMGMCGKRADFVKALNDKYQESNKALGIAGQVNLVELFSSKTGSWTILVTTPEGKTCIIAAGNSWENLPEVVEGESM